MTNVREQLGSLVNDIIRVWAVVETVLIRNPDIAVRVEANWPQPWSPYFMSTADFDCSIGFIEESPYEEKEWHCGLDQSLTDTEMEQALEDAIIRFRQEPLIPQ